MWRARKISNSGIAECRDSEDRCSVASPGGRDLRRALKLESVSRRCVFYPVPIDKLTAAVCPEAKLRKLVRNMIYVGVVAQDPRDGCRGGGARVRQQFAKKQKAADLNWSAVQAGYEYAVDNLTKNDPYVVEKMNATAGKIIIDGNEAAAWARCLRASRWLRGIRSRRRRQWLRA